MLSDAQLDRLARYRATIGQAWSHGDTNVWPVKLNASIHLFVKEFGEELLDDLAWLEARGHELGEIAHGFQHPARLFRVIDSTVYSMRRNHAPLARQREVTLKLLDMTKALKHGSEFNEDGRNTIYSPEQAEAISGTVFAGAIESQADRLLVHRFCAVMWAYTESIFFRAHDVTKEIHGPYPVDHGRRQFIVKEYLNLRPVEIWPDMPLLSCRTVKVYEEYSNAVKLTIDALNHLYHQGGPLVPNLMSCAVEVDGALQPVGVLGGFVADTRETITSISRYVDAISWNDRVQKYADIFWFRKKPLCDLRGRDWRVPEAVRENIRAGSANERRRQPLSDEASERLAMLTI